MRYPILIFAILIFLGSIAAPKESYADDADSDEDTPRPVKKHRTKPAEEEDDVDKEVQRYIKSFSKSKSEGEPILPVRSSRSLDSSTDEDIFHIESDGRKRSKSQKKEKSPEAGWLSMGTPSPVGFEIPSPTQR